MRREAWAMVVLGLVGLVGPAGAGEPNSAKTDWFAARMEEAGSSP